MEQRRELREKLCRLNTKRIIVKKMIVILINFVRMKIL